MDVDLFNPQCDQRDLLLDEAHVWMIKDEDIQDKKVLNAFYQVLSNAEKNKKSKFHFAKHRQQYLVTRGLLRWVLSYYQKSVLPAHWRFRKNKYGRPYLANSLLDGDIYFNVSHTENLIVIVVSRADLLGIDVEWILRKNNPVDIADGFFSSLELTRLKALSTQQQVEHFFKLWTLKEAYVKARGMGLSIPLNSFEFNFDAGTIDMVGNDRCHDTCSAWSFFYFVPENNYRLSIAYGTQEDCLSNLCISFFNYQSGCFSTSTEVDLLASSRKNPVRCA